MYKSALPLLKDKQFIEGFRKQIFQLESEIFRAAASIPRERDVRKYKSQVMYIHSEMIAEETDLLKLNAAYHELIKLNQKLKLFWYYPGRPLAKKMTENVSFQQFSNIQEPVSYQQTKSSLTPAQQQQKQKLEQQFSVVTPLIIVYIKQMFIMFFLKVTLYQIEENGMGRNEKTIAYLFLVIYYILYFNSLYKFGNSFYNIMKNSLIDETDIMMLELIGTTVFGLLYLLYGVLYCTTFKNEGNTYYGECCIGVGVSIFIQCFLLRKFYMAQQSRLQDDKKTN
ncbi:UNKNOWN [Stylonychia lemnae]|uniref:Uncharacterized protein n=1 Tax=Stylonychia lemnae TaxID=5949 RepID=A0A078AQ13_STYLE|nr:UNKNOWN [Stylonychia lemnae]|eukprot:CDW83033.1 UNKNOWN [Stylonychia lemnae]